jgi:hypothetical protein
MPIHHRFAANFNFVSLGTIYFLLSTGTAVAGPTPASSYLHCRIVNKNSRVQ